MSVHVSSWAWRVPLPASEKLVLLKLADCSNDEGECWPSQERMARETGLTDRTVRACIGRLVGRGLLATTHRRDGQRQDTTLYRLRRNELPADDAVSGGISPQSQAEAASAKPSEEPSGALPNGRARSDRGEVYDALCSTYFPEGSTPTGREARKTGIAASNIHAAGGRAADVPVRAAKLAKVMPPGTTLTPMALASNWALAAAPAAASDPGCPYCLMRGGQHSSECEAVRPAAEDGAP